MLTITHIFTKIIRWYFRNKSPNDFEMVSYWKRQESIAAKVTKAEDGSTVMYMEGEKYPFPGFPRGFILVGDGKNYTNFSKIKHEIKNQVFNESWRKLAIGTEEKEIIQDIKKVLLETIPKLAEKSQYDMLPPTAMCPAVREIHRAWTKVSPETSQLRDYLCFILQEDDAYRWRVGWLPQWFSWFMKLNPVKSFDFALGMLEHGEVVGDMKERARLLRRVLMLALEDKGIRDKFIALFREIDWKKVRLTPGDKYHFRGKYFKVDYKYIEY